MGKRAALILCALVGAFVGMFIAAPGASAAGEAVLGTLRNSTDQTPVANVRITVQREDGAPVAEARSGPDGRWRVELPGPGTYKVAIDEASLPEGVSLTDGDKKEAIVRVLSGQRKPALFPIGKGDRKTSGQLAEALQLSVEGLRFGLIIALAAVGLSLIYGTTGLTNFAHGELVTFGGVMAFFFNVTIGMHLIPAALLALVVSAVVGLLMDQFFSRRLRGRGSGLIAMMIISIGVSILLRYLILFFFGGSTRAYAQYSSQNSLGLGPVSLAPRDLVSMIIAAVVLFIVGMALLRTRLGKATRAVADNPALAASSGIDVERVVQIVWVAGAILAALGGVLLGIAQQVGWNMGFQILLLVFAAVTLGGLGTAFGALVGSLIVGVFIQVSTVVLPPELKNVGALGVLIVILLVRPQGILGRRERIG